ncbi:response regulator transcription factor [Nocardioides acrostichi]|uniref:Response regulator transcription factor n=1 Tax=Nocardioides acrostichi TaxID=2784339 RepID=A0A930YB62_9ACTN|nr:response regulator transcription factor [Nocardioides acrostichi]MBF4162128.1 response regulator transcription factor [Nocardioides acrostichi]
MTRVLVIDDEPQVRLALRGALARAGFDVLLAADGREGFETLATAAPDVVVLDLGLPDTDGLDLVRTLRTWTTVPVLILSGMTDAARKVAALEAGADDYLQKPFGLDELVARLRALLRRTQAAADDEVSRMRTFGELAIDLGDQIVTRQGESVHLTPTERRLLEALVTNPGKLLTHRWLLHTVWDSGHGDETRAALRAHLRSLRSKIGDDAQTPRYIATESGAGYRWIALEAERAPLIAGAATADDGLDSVGDPDGQVLPSRAHPDEVGIRQAAHDVNNALTALRLALHVVRSRVARQDDSAAPSELAVPWQRFESALGRVGTLVLDLERKALGEAPPDSEG